MNYLGIDNGISGGLVWLSEHSKIIASLPMPVQKTRKGQEVNVLEVKRWLFDEIVTTDKTVVVIEEPGGSKSYNAAVSMAGSFHSLRALFEISRFRLVRITPQKWQKPMLNCQKDQDTKQVADQLRRSLWPDESFLASERCKKADLGLIDAALIAEYARRNKL